MEQHFVRFFSAGTFIAEQTVKRIDFWDCDKAVQMSKEITERYGAKPYGFRFYTENADYEPIAQSEMYYINGIIKTLDELEAERNPDNNILISNMKWNGWDKVVITHNPYKWTQPFYEGDRIITI